MVWSSKSVPCTFNSLNLPTNPILLFPFLFLIPHLFSQSPFSFSLNSLSCGAIFLKCLNSIFKAQLQPYLKVSSVDNGSQSSLYSCSYFINTWLETHLFLECCLCLTTPESVHMGASWWPVICLSVDLFFPLGRSSFHVPYDPSWMFVFIRLIN